MKTVKKFFSLFLAMGVMVAFVAAAACGVANDKSEVGGKTPSTAPAPADIGTTVPAADGGTDTTVTCDASDACPSGTVMTKLACDVDGNVDVECTPTPAADGGTGDDMTTDVVVECPDGTSPSVQFADDGETVQSVSCVPVAQPPVAEPPPATQPPPPATVTVAQDSDSVQVSLSGDYRNLGAWQAEGGQPLAAGTDLSGCTLAPASAATGWDGQVAAGSATGSMAGDTAAVEWSEQPAPAGNCVGAVDGTSVSSAQTVITFRAICPDGKRYWPDLGAWKRVGAAFVYWTDVAGVWRGGLCRAASS